MRLKNVFIFFLSLCVAIGMTSPVGAASEHTSLVIFHTNDSHGRVLKGDDKGKAIGFAEITAAVKSAKAQNPCSLWLDAGDTFHGMPIISVSKGENMVRILQATGVDALAPGNHDFDYGAAQLTKLAKELPFPLIAANIAFKNNDTKLFLPEYKIFSLPNNLKVGVFGLATPETAYKTNPLNVADLEFLNPVETAKKMVAELQPQCDVLVALTHLGVDPSSVYTSERIAAEVPGIDVIIDGHSHTTLHHGLAVGDTLIAQTGCYANALGQVTVELTDGKVTNKTAVLLHEQDVSRLNPVPDRKVAQILSELEKENAKMLNEVVTRTDRNFPNEYHIVRTSETELGNLTADAMRSVTGADAAVINSGTIRSGLPQGKVKRGDILSIFPFGNTVQRTEVNGAVLKEVLELSVAGYPGAQGGFLQVSGLKFTFDAAKPAGKRVTSVTVNGQPLDEEKIYSLAVSDFMKVGGDDYKILKPLPLTGIFDTLDTVLMDYLNQNPHYTSVLDRITIINKPKSVMQILKDADAAQKQAA